MLISCNFNIFSDLKSLHLFIWIVKFLSLYVDELNDDDDDEVWKNGNKAQHAIVSRNVDFSTNEAQL